MTAQTPACIVVYSESGADASLTPLAQVPVTLSPAAHLPGTGAETSSLALLFGAALALVIGGILLRRRTTRHT
jgi:LPXTG-motif cell wall-anchored protein